MRGENFGDRPRFLLLFGLDLLEEIYERRRVIPCLVEVLQAEEVRLRFEASGERQEAQGDRQAGALPDGVASPAAHKNERNAGVIDDLAACRLSRAVTSGYMSDLVRHHARHFR